MNNNQQAARQAGMPGKKIKGMTLFYGVLIVLGVFIYVAEGVAVNPFAIWNGLPLFISYELFNRGRKDGERSKIWGAVGFLVGSMALSIYVHLAWMFDWDKIKTGSSTAGLIFIFIPIYSLITGGIGYIIGWGIGRMWSGNGKHKCLS